MKTMKKIIVAVMMFTIVTSYATENIIAKPSKAITLFKFSDVKKGHHYTILDNQGIVLYSETIKRNGTYLKQFDFTALNTGSYTIELEKDFEIIVTPFIIQSNTVLFLESKETTIFKPVVRVEDNRLLISHMSLNAQPLKIELFYKGESVYKGELKGDKVLKQVYILSAQEKGDYYLLMSSGERFFNRTFEL